MKKNSPSPAERALALGAAVMLMGVPWAQAQVSAPAAAQAQSQGAATGGELHPREFSPVPYLGVGLASVSVPLDGLWGVAPGTSKNASAYQLVAGVRPWRYAGVELNYVASNTVSGNDGENYLRLAGPSLDAVGFLPIQSVDLFGKVGIDRLHSSGQLSGTFLCIMNRICNPFPISTTSNGLTYGAGLQYHWHQLSLRAEYQRYTISTGHPDLVGVSVLWTPRMD